MSVDILKQQIKIALEEGSNASQDLDNEVDVYTIREETADKIAKAVQNYIKTSLTTVIGGGVAIPQDGGTGLKSTMQVLIQGI